MADQSPTRVAEVNFSPDPAVRVVIETPPLSVTVEAPGVRLADVRRHAVEIYRELWHDGMRTNPIAAGGLGFQAERDEDAR
jgi:hypothetical protein